jgi:hypothetical protein
MCIGKYLLTRTIHSQIAAIFDYYKLETYAPIKLCALRAEHLYLYHIMLFSLPKYSIIKSLLKLYVALNINLVTRHVTLSILLQFHEVVVWDII